METILVEKRCGHCSKSNKDNKTNVKIKLKTCSKCEKMVYCSTDCQKKDWLVHKKYCIKSDSIKTIHEKIIKWFDTFKFLKCGNYPWKSLKTGKFILVCVSNVDEFLSGINSFTMFDEKFMDKFSKDMSINNTDSVYIQQYMACSNKMSILDTEDMYPIFELNGNKKTGVITEFINEYERYKYSHIPIIFTVHVQESMTLMTYLEEKC